MPAFCTSGLRSFVDSPTLLTGYDPVMRCGVDRQLPVSHVVYHGDMHAMYLRHYQQQQQQVRVDTTKHQVSTDAVKNENGNEKERNLRAAMPTVEFTSVKSHKYDLTTLCVV